MRKPVGKRLLPPATVGALPLGLYLAGSSREVHRGGGEGGLAQGA